MAYTPNPELLFYLTRPAPCPYLAGQVEQKIFARLEGETTSDLLLNTRLNQHGFRRSQTMLYRPACPACMACVPVRIDLSRFKADRRLRRIEKKNANLMHEQIPVEQSNDLFPLFNQYQVIRHAEGDMVEMNEKDFAAMMQNGGANAFLLALRSKEGEVIGAMLVDRLQDGMSAVYSFYKPDEQARSLGNELILRLIETAQTELLPYVYLGYWIRDCRKMAYKSNFPALQRLTPDGWKDFVAT